MKYAALALLLLVPLCVTASALAAKDPRLTKRIDISATAADTTIDVDGDRNELRLLWNLNFRSTPIGHAFIHCSDLGRLGGGGPISYCHGLYVFPLGKIVVEGIRRNRRRVTYVVTGGTGRYLDASGTLRVTTHGPGQLHLAFRLTP